MRLNTFNPFNCTLLQQNFNMSRLFRGIRILYVGEEKTRTRDVERVCLANIPVNIPSRASDLVYGGSQVKITRISRCPGSICSRGGDDVVEIKSSFDRRGGQGREDGVAARRNALDEDESGILLRKESALKKLLPPGRRACVHYRSEFIRTTAISRYRPR